MTGTARQVTIVLVTVLTIVMNYLSNALPLFGRTNAQVSDNLPNAFTPAGLTFAVWGVIYLGLTVFAVYQALPAQRRPRFDRLFWPYLVSSVLNVSWLFAFQSLNLGLSVLVMLGLLVTLITLYLRVRSLKPLGAEYAALQVPVSLYLAWICVATMANVTAFLVSQGLGTGALGLNGPLWSALLAVIAGLLGTVFLARFRDVAFALVLLWALYGVYAARPDVWAVGVGTALAAALLVLGVVGTLRRRRLAGSRV